MYDCTFLKFNKLPPFVYSSFGTFSLVKLHNKYVVHNSMLLLLLFICLFAGHSIRFWKANHNAICNVHILSRHPKSPNGLQSTTKLTTCICPLDALNGPIGNGIILFSRWWNRNWNCDLNEWIRLFYFLDDAASQPFRWMINDRHSYWKKTKQVNEKLFTFRGNMRMSRKFHANLSWQMRKHLPPFRVALSMFSLFFI